MTEISSLTAPYTDLSRVKRLQGFDRIRAEYPVYLSDESKLTSTGLDALYFPTNEAELAAVVRHLSEQGMPLTIAGARTGLVGGCVPQGGALVSLEFFDQVEAIYFDADCSEWRVRAQAGVSLKSLEGSLRIKHFPQLEHSNDPWVLGELEHFKADRQSYFYPPDPTEMSASLGGSVATNASGARTYRYGPTRAWVRAIRVFLANGEYLDIPRGRYFASADELFTIRSSTGCVSTFCTPGYELPKTKSTSGFYAAPGMDLIDLFIGSEGVLGIITRVDVALLKRENKISIIQFLDSDDQAIQVTEALRAEKRLHLDFLEFYSENALDLLRGLQESEPSTVGMPPLPQSAGSALFMELDFDPHAEGTHFDVLEKVISGCGANIENSWAAYEPRELDRFKSFRHMLPETINQIIAERKKIHPGLHKLGTDLAVPDEHLKEIWQLYREGCEGQHLDWVAFGHIGNNHIHVNILPRDMQDLEKGLNLYEQFATRAVALGGAVSAEHGIGKIKPRFLKLMYSYAQLDQMREIKHALDPHGLLNPGDLLPEEAS